MREKFKKILPFLVIATSLWVALVLVREKALQTGCEIGVSMTVITFFPETNGTIALEKVSHDVCVRKFESLR